MAVVLKMAGEKRRFRTFGQSIPGTIKPPTKICLVDSAEDLFIRKVAMEFNLKLVVPENNNNSITPESRTIYIVLKFDDKRKLLTESEYTKDTWVLGPTAVKQLARNTSLEFPNKPVYSTSMYGLVIYINCPHDYPLMRHLTELIKWMGGLFVARPNGHMTHMVTNSALAKGCRYCYAFNVPILTPTWVEYCWERRDDIDFTAISAVDGRFSLPMFANLRFAFEGFSETEYKRMETITMSNGGSVAAHPTPQCSHVVIDNDFTGSIAHIPLDVRYRVTGEWFQKCVYYNERQDEDEYLYISNEDSFEEDGNKDSICPDYTQFLEEFQTKMKESVVTFVKKNLRRSKSCNLAEPFNMTGDEGTDCRTSTMRKDSKEHNTSEMIPGKLKYNFQELCDTEKNYRDSLAILMSIQIYAGEVKCVISEEQSKLIFRNIGKILKIHEKLAKLLEEPECRDNMNAGYAYHVIKEEMQAEYVTYSKFVHDCMARFENAENTDAAFNKIVTNIQEDCKKESRKIQHPKHLFALPIQRLGSTALLLHEMKQHMDEGKAKDSVIKAISLIKDILHEMDADRAKTEDMETLFNIYRLIQDCPAHLITSLRKFITKFSGQEILGKKESCGNEFTFFIFTDIIEVTKKRKKPGKHSSQYLYTHVGLIPLSCIRHILLFGCDTQKSGAYETPMKFAFYIKDLEDKTHLCGFKFLEEKEDGPVVDFLNMIACQLFKQNVVLSQSDVFVHFDEVTTKFDALENALNSILVGIHPHGAIQFDVNTRKQSKLRRSLSASEIL